MTNQAQGRKISNFASNNTVPSGAYLSYIYNDTNYKILDTDFYSALGVTGTLTQLGSTTSVPVLDKAGSVNRIRNLEAGNGINVGVSAYNGAKISHNFVNGTGGLNLIKDPDVTQPIIRNIQAGANISVAVDDDTDSIVVNYTGTSTSSKTVIVQSESDFPAAVAGVITLADDTDYLIVQDITTSNRFAVPNTTNMQGPASTLITITYTGSGNMFTLSAASNAKFNNLAFNCASGALVNGTASGTGQVQFIECRVVSCDTIGSVGDMFLIRFDRVAFAAITTGGLTITGSNTVLFMDGVYIFLNGGDYLDLGTATFDNIYIHRQIVLSSAGGTTFLKGAAASANLTAGNIGFVIGCSFTGSVTPLSGIANDDNQWDFKDNTDIPDTITFGMLSMPSNATNTVISVATTPVLVAGTWTVEESHQTTCTTGGRVTYEAVRDKDLNVTASVSVAPASGGNVAISAYIAVNGTVVTNSRRSSSASSGQPTSITLPWYADLTNADYVEVYVANDDTTTDLLVSSAVLRVG